jgi:uncharacterized protein with HEPN domain
MMDGRRAIDDWLEDIVHWGERLARHISGMTREQFMLDEKTQDASAKCAEAIGEAAGEILRIESDFDSRNPELQLKAAYKSRNRLSHGYYSIDLWLLWNTIATSVPATLIAAKQILGTRASQSNRKQNDGGSDDA